MLEGEMGLIVIEGEISNFVRAASGHLYFSLKDAGAQVRCAMFKLRAGYLKLQPANGMMVSARARVTLYEPRGEFQLVIESLQDAGVGALNRQFEVLKAKLNAEGLFDLARKRPLPKFPRELALITSPAGAAVQDVLSVLSRRFPTVSVTIYPAQVQGAAAAGELLDAFNAVLAAGRHDLVLFTRGGGSAEDLFAFNDEALVRAVANAPLPIVSAVGHETDFTLLDFVADLRAPTPSAAAELMVPDQLELMVSFAQGLARLERALGRRLERSAQRLDQLSAQLRVQHPMARIARNRDRLRAGAAKLKDPSHQLERARERSARLRLRLHEATQAALRMRRQRQAIAVSKLDALSPLATLARGYSILLDAQGNALTHVKQLRLGELIEAKLSDGRAGLTVSSL